MVEQMEPDRGDARLRTLAQELGDKACPVCARPMREHFIDHSTRNAVLNCPVPHPGAWDRDAFEPVNELGMVIHARPNSTPSTP
ncbi:hypothetical protein [Cryobacterium roopkundense]|uniref:Uncharacterized protein n=1 Tax=Cryobacterium roopkundense TaxID=1001240 RepID=A0A7W9E4R7_9MICO|nr:hypothetical protein [Cryobacterium roopkundense]MBB5641200.1 hypothetical protein [Cryobacterium roopkundense]